MNQQVPLHPAAQPHCPQCDGLGILVVRDGERAIAQKCTCVGMCPQCRDTTWVPTSTALRAPRRRCQCHELVRRMGLFDRANIPARHARSTRATFRPADARQTATLIGVSQWLDHYQPGEDNHGMVLYGGVGRGKTHLVVAMLRELVFRYGVSVRFVEFSHLLADLKAGFDHGLGSSRLIDPLVAVDVLAIDELGKGRNTEFEGTVLDELVSRRYNAAATIIATTNFSPNPSPGRAGSNPAAVAVGKSLPATLPDRVGARVFSRLEEMCDFIEIQGPDHRSQRRTQRRR